jgi:hypothetical protein
LDNRKQNASVRTHLLLHERWPWDITRTRKREVCGCWEGLWSIAGEPRTASLLFHRMICEYQQILPVKQCKYNLQFIFWCTFNVCPTTESSIGNKKKRQYMRRRRSGAGTIQGRMSLYRSSNWDNSHHTCLEQLADIAWHMKTISH